MSIFFANFRYDSTNRVADSETFYDCDVYRTDREGVEFVESPDRLPFGHRFVGTTSVREFAIFNFCLFYFSGSLGATVLNSGPPSSGEKQDPRTRRNTVTSNDSRPPIDRSGPTPSNTTHTAGTRQRFTSARNASCPSHRRGRK